MTSHKNNGTSRSSGASWRSNRTAGAIMPITHLAQSRQSHTWHNHGNHTPGTIVPITHLTQSCQSHTTYGPSRNTVYNIHFLTSLFHLRTHLTNMVITTWPLFFSSATEWPQTFFSRCANFRRMFPLCLVCIEKIQRWIIHISVSLICVTSPCSRYVRTFIL